MIQIFGLKTDLDFFLGEYNLLSVKNIIWQSESVFLMVHEFYDVVLIVALLYNNAFHTRTSVGQSYKKKKKQKFLCNVKDNEIISPVI